MDPLTVVGLIGSVLQYIKVYVRYVYLEPFYENGPSGILVVLFGSQTVRRTLKSVLASSDGQLAMQFRKAMMDESNMIAIAGAILAQIAITALSLSELSQAHWVARALFTFSLVSSIIAVYYATEQYRTMVRFLGVNQIKAWITGKSKHTNWNVENYPSSASVLSVSGPGILLSASVYSFLAGFGVYLGYVWRRDLDPVATSDDSKAVFITYIVSVAVCFFAYAISNALVAADNYAGESDPGQADSELRDGPQTYHGTNQFGNMRRGGGSHEHGIYLDDFGETTGSYTQRSRDGLREQIVCQNLSEMVRLREQVQGLNNHLSQLLEGLARN
ncbi:hypothetical protein AUP68_06352 [Ilyonectria robusta]